MALSFSFSSHNPSAGLFLSMEQGNNESFSDNKENSNQSSSPLFCFASSDGGFDTFFSPGAAETIGNIAFAGGGVETAGSVAFAGGGFDGASSAGGGFSCGSGGGGCSCGGDSGGFVC